MAGKGFGELQRVFVKDSKSDGKSEVDAIATINKAKAKSVVATESVTTATNNASQVTNNESQATNNEKSDDAPSRETGSSPTAVTLTQDQLSIVIQNALASALKPYEDKTAALQQQLNAAQQQADADKAATVEELNRTKTERDKLADVFKLMGSPNPVQKDNLPSFNRHHGVSKEPDGLAKDFIELLADRNACPSVLWTDPNSGDRFVQKDTRIAQRFYRKHKRELLDSLETAMKRQGFLAGNIVTDAATSGVTSGAAGSVPDSIMLEALSTMMRETHSPRYIYWQFPVTVVRLGNGPNANIQIPRYSFLDEPTSVADFELSTLTTYVDINPNNQALIMTTIPATVREYGLGKGTNIGTRPVAIPEFISAYSLTDLMAALNSRIGHNYHGFEDLAIRSLFAATTQVRYNKNGSVVSIAASVVAGDDGTMSENFLNNLHADFRISQIPTYPDGCYTGVLHPIAVAQFKNDLGDQWHPPTEAAIQELTNMLMASGSAETEKVSGYLGKWCGFHLYEQNAHSCGASGTEGVQTENIGGSANITRSSYFFGPGAVGRGIGMPMDIRVDNSGTFGRLNRYVWISHESFTVLDLDSALNPNQGTRCIEVRTTDRRV